MRKEFTRAITGALSIGLILGMFPGQMYASEQLSINQEEKEASIEHATVLVSPDPRYTTVFNNGDYNYKILSQENKTVEINRYLPNEQSGNEISIPEQVKYDGEIYTVTSIGISAFSGYSELTGGLVIPNTVTNIGENAFKRCTGLTGDLIIPDSVINIGVGAFAECTGFNGKISIPNSVINIGLAAFCGCSGLIGDLVIPDSVTDIGYQAFMGCTGLNGKLVISNNLEKIESNVFRDCSGLTGNLIIPDSVTTIGNYAFDKCSQLTGELIIPSGVTSIGLTAFGECLGFTGNLIIPESVIYIGDNAFIFCENIKSITIPFNLSNIEGKPFVGCENVDIVKLNYGQLDINNQEYNEWKTFITDKMGLNEEKIESGYIFNTTETKQVKGPGIEIPDTEAPVFNYTGESTITLKNGSEFTLPKVTASDNKDESVAITCVIRDSSDEIIPAIDTKITGTYTITYSATDEAGNEATPLVITVVVKEEVASIQFKDGNFKNALIDASVDKNNDGEITIQEMEQITELWIQEKQIKDISEIKYAKNLKKLYIAENQIVDISMLVHLPLLQTLQAPWNQITDISILPQIKTLTDINLSGNNIKNIDLFEQMPWVTSLGLYTCGIENIEVLRQLPELEELFIGNNDLSEIEIIGELNSLKSLSLPSSDIKDFSFISKLVKLEELYLSDNKIKDLDGLENLIELRYLSLDNNLIDNLNFLPVKGYQYLNVANNYLDISENSSAMQIIKHIEGLGGEIRYSPQNESIPGDSDEIIEFKDPKLKQALIDEGVDTNKDGNITTGEMYRVTALNLNKNGITDISGLEYATNLEWLDISENPISDLKPISKLHKIFRLEMHDCKITSLEDIKGLTNITSLGVSNNNIGDITPLQEMTKLETLYMYQCGITNIEVLVNLKKLQQLSLGNNDLTDISALSTLPNLQVLKLFNCNLKDISSLSSIRTLQHLQLSSNHIVDINFLKELKNLTHLYLNNNRLINIEGISELINIIELDLAYNYLDISENSSSIKVIEKIQALGGEINYIPQKSADTEAPIINYAGETTITVEYGANLTVPEVTATDNKDESLLVSHVIKDNTNKVITTINTKVAGTYIITYTAVDKAGNEATPLVVTVVVKGDLDTEAPVLSYTGKTTIIVENGSNFTVPEVAATDNKDESIEVSKVIRNSNNEVITTINTKVAGTYTITYSAVDKTGNEANPLVITVVVEQVSSGGNSGAGGGGGGSVKSPTTEKVIEKLDKKEKEIIINNFKEDIPYTSLTTGLTLEQLKKLTNTKFTDKQLQEILDKPELLEKLGVDKSMLSDHIVLKPVENATFTDVPEIHWASDSIKLAAELGLIAGMPNGAFEPSTPLQVADTFTFLDRVLLLNGITEMKLPKSTVEKYITNKEHWAFANMASIGSKLNKSTLQVISELGEQPISRELLAQVLYEITNGELEKIREEIAFEDIADSHCKEAINYCTRVGLLSGVDSIHMAPKKALTRAELMSVITRLNDMIK